MVYKSFLLSAMYIKYMAAQLLILPYLAKKAMVKVGSQIIEILSVMPDCCDSQPRYI